MFSTNNGINETMTTSSNNLLSVLSCFNFLNAYLIRDTNGWCPFCERVWVAIRAKGIPYQETTVSLQNKPEWYVQDVLLF